MSAPFGPRVPTRMNEAYEQHMADRRARTIAAMDERANLESMEAAEPFLLGKPDHEYDRDNDPTDLELHMLALEAEHLWSRADAPQAGI